jgi:hypothetical protein
VHIQATLLYQKNVTHLDDELLDELDDDDELLLLLLEEDELDDDELRHQDQ